MTITGSHPPLSPLDGRVLTVVASDDQEDVGHRSIRLHEHDRTLWGSYGGPAVHHGQLIARQHSDGSYHGSYHHIGNDGALHAGEWHAEVELPGEQRVRLVERWTPRRSNGAGGTLHVTSEDVETRRVLRSVLNAPCDHVALVPSDERDVYDILAMSRALAVHEPSIGTDTVTERRVRAWLERPDVQLRMVRVDHELAGYVAVERDGPEVRVLQLYIRRGHRRRGVALGVARALAEEHANCRRVCFAASPGNLELQHLAARLAARVSRVEYTIDLF